MIRIALRRIFNRKSHSITTIIAMICVLTIVPLGVHFSQQSKLTVAKTIEQYGRGSYDILVRPADSRTNVENELGVVEENYIGDGAGGISINEWKEVKKNHDIEIAAPVASLGYFSGNRTSIELPLLKSPSRFSYDYYTSDGVHTYPIPDEFLDVYPSTVNDKLKQVIYYFGGEPFQYADYFAAPETVTGFMDIRFPKNYYLLAAIDVESEEKLTGIDYSDLERQLDEDEKKTIETFLIYRGDAPVVPILQRSQLNIPLYLSLTIDELDIDITKYKNKYGISPDAPMFTIDEKNVPQLEKDISEAPVVSTKNYDIDLSKYQNPFNGTHLVLNENFKLKKAPGGSLLNDTSVYYTASKVNYDTQNELLQVAELEGKQPPLYKEIEKHGKSYMEEMSAPFMLWQMGTFTPPDSKQSLTSSPLGIYSTEDVTTTDGKTMTPTITPGSFIAQPAAGVTTLEAAELIKGKKPIDAIRIRVAGINTYNEQAQIKIEKVATELLNKGYEVDIVAGSSFKKLQMDVEGVGIVTAPWTTLGVAQKLTSGWDIVTLTNILLFAMFGIAWFAARLLYERNAISEENGILQKLGWQEKKIRLRNICEQLLILSCAFLISAVILILFTFTNTMITYTAFVLIGLVAAAIIWLFFSRNSQSLSRPIAYKKSISFMYYRNLIIPIMLVLIISFTLITIQVVAIVVTIASSNVTTLGAFTMDAAFYFQLIVLIATLSLALISVSDALNAMLHNRKDEFQMYHIIGWRKEMIRRHFGKEVTVWAGVSFIVGIIISMITLVLLGIQLYWITLGFLGTSVLIVIPLIIMIRTKKLWIS